MAYRENGSQNIRKPEKLSFTNMASDHIDNLQTFHKMVEQREFSLRILHIDTGRHFQNYFNIIQAVGNRE